MCRSRWIDVRGSADGNAVIAEIDALDLLLRDLLAHDIGRDRIRVVAPFTDVVRAARQRLDRSVNRNTDTKIEVGTIHSVQGIEAEVVVLVLGGGTSRARDWAADTPNLLNVAVSRARRRFYVIGDREGWSTRRFFVTAARLLADGSPGSASDMTGRTPSDRGR